MNTHGLWALSTRRALTRLIWRLSVRFWAVARRGKKTPSKVNGGFISRGEESMGVGGYGWRRVRLPARKIGEWPGQGDQFMQSYRWHCRLYNHAPPTFRSASKIVLNWTLIESLLNHFLLLPRFLQCAVKDLAEIPTPSLDFKFQAAHSSSPKCWLGKTESINHLPWPCALLIDRETCLRHDCPNQYNSYRTLPTP